MTQPNGPIPTPDFETYSMDVPLTSASVEDDVVRVTWADGVESQFHHLWLRDNCACDKCIDSGSHERVYSILLLPEGIRRRVLHGRRAFDASSGLRHIRTSYGEREELLSSIRMIERARAERLFGFTP